MRQGKGRAGWWKAVAVFTVGLGALGCGGGGEDKPPAGGGTPDNGGTTPLPPEPPKEEGHALAVSNGGLIVVGSTLANLDTTGADLLVRRYTFGGEVDTTFGDQGSTVVDFGGPVKGPLSGEREQDDLARTVSILPDGRILVAGFAQALSRTDGRDLGLVRLTPTGQLDTTFNKTGRLRVHFGPTDDFYFRAVAQSLLPLADGRFYVGGFISKAGDTVDDDFALLRYQADGTLDTSFTSKDNQAGSWLGRAYTNVESVQGMVLQGTSVVLAGGDHFAAVRILSSGSQDLTFGTSGLARSEDGRAHAMAARPGGGLLLAGERQDVKVGGTNHGVLKLVAYTKDGKLDTGFGTGGVRELTAPEDALDVIDVSGLHMFADGRFLVYADVRAQPVLMRFLANGQLDTSLGNGGLVRWPQTKLALPLFIRPTSGPKVAVSGNQAFITDTNTYNGQIIPDGTRQVLFKSTGL
jgi:uncharacterized delta-60 repeat protein